ncbi:hypothetical protein AB0M54_10415 [Actinoplanes sp. NPDC051470]|uniref:hypothetical protein n=1 Tax=Actinoplanes sp. NPDC051470 TaxID=3157224 RepID=UPI003439A038
MRRRLVEAAWVILVIAVAVPLFMLRVDGPQRVASGDSYWYMRQAQIFAGVDPVTAAAVARREVCRDINRASRKQGGQAPCVEYDVMTTPRYAAIFHSRPGYPLFGSPFVAVLGAWRGMMAATLVLALIAVVLAYLAVWLATGRRLAGLVAAIALLLLPSGFWMTRMLVESATLAGCLAVLLGATLTWRGRRLGGLVLAGGGLVWLFPVRSASALAVSLALLAASVILGLLARRRPQHAAPAPAVPPAPVPAARVPAAPAPAAPAPAAPAPAARVPAPVPTVPVSAVPASGSAARRAGVLPIRAQSKGGLWWTAALAGAALLGWAVVSSVWHLPSLNETIQDRATDHFSRPDIADPLAYLTDLNLRFWRRWLSANAHEPGAMASVALAIVVLAVRLRRDAVLWILVGLSGFALVVAHPLISQQPRLSNPMWIPVAAVIGWAVAVMVHRRPRSEERPESRSEGGDGFGALAPGEGAQQGGGPVPAVRVPEKQG